MEDMRAHWAEWRVGWEQKLAQNEIQFLRSVADLQSAFSYRADLMDSNYRDALRATARGFHGGAGARQWRLSRIAASHRYGASKLDYERLIHTELRLIRQRAGPGVAAGPGRRRAF